MGTKSRTLYKIAFIVDLEVHIILPKFVVMEPNYYSMKAGRIILVRQIVVVGYLLYRFCSKIII